MIIGLFFVFACGGCKRFDLATAGVTNDPLQPRLLTLEAHFDRFGDPERPVNDIKMRLFRKELEENLIDPFGEVYGDVMLSQTVIEHRARLFLLTPLLLYTPILIGLPLATPTMELELELRFFDANRRLIGRYTARGKGRERIAMYHGYNLTGVQKIYVDALNMAFDDLRQQVRQDAVRLNSELQRSGRKYPMR